MDRINGIWTPIDDKTLKQLGVHCHFKGKGQSQTTSRKIPAQSIDEASLQRGLFNYGTTGLNNATKLLSQANTAVNNAYTPDWQNLYDNYYKYSGQMTNDYQNAMVGLYDDYNNTANSALKNYQNTTGKYLTNYTNSSNNNLNNYNRNMAGVTSAYQSLANGELPSSYAAARQQALNADLTGTVGNALNGLGSRGILNSSVTTGALDNISKNASDTLAKNYASDLATESGLIGNQANNYSNIYGTNQTNANNLYSNQYNNAVGLFNNTMSNAQSIYNNGYNGLNANLNAGNNYLTDTLNNASTAQNKSYTPATQLYSAASNNYTPGSGLFNTLYSGRMGTGTTTQTTNDGGASQLLALAQIASLFA